MGEAGPLVVLIHGQVAGEAAQMKDGRLSFTYDPDYLDSSHTTPLSLSMPPGGSEYGDDILRQPVRPPPPCRRGLRRSGAAHPEERLGAVLRGKGGIDWLTGADVEAILRGLERDPTAWHARGTGQFSLAGAQAKTALYLDTGSGTWGVPWGATPTSHILKPQITGSPITTSTNTSASRR